MAVEGEPTEEVAPDREDLYAGMDSTLWLKNLPEDLRAALIKALSRELLQTYCGIGVDGTYILFNKRPEEVKALPLNFKLNPSITDGDWSPERQYNGQDELGSDLKPNNPAHVHGPENNGPLTEHDSNNSR